MLVDIGAEFWCKGDGLCACPDLSVAPCYYQAPVLTALTFSTSQSASISFLLPLL